MNSPYMNQNNPKIPATVNDQWNYLLSTIWDRTLHIVISLDTSLDEKRLCAAVTRILNVFPIITCRFVECKKPFWTHCTQTPPDSFFDCITTTNTQESVSKIISTPLDPATGPQVRVILIRSGKDTLCISMSHSAADATGMKMFAETLSSIYRNLKHNPDYSPQIFEQDRSFHTLLSSIAADKGEVEEWLDCDHTSPWGGISLGSAQRSAPVRVIQTIQAQNFIKIKDWAKQQGLTINDVLITAFFFSLADTFSLDCGHIYPILTSIDLRRYLPSESGPVIANLSVAFEVPFNYSHGSSFPEAIREIGHVMREQKEGYAGIGAAIRISRDFDRGYFQVRRNLLERARLTQTGNLPKMPFFANAGIILPGSLNFGAGKVQHAFIAPPVEYPPGIGLAVSTFQDELTLCTGFCESPSWRRVAESITQNMERLLLLL